jgi:hypothetical protein
MPVIGLTRSPKVQKGALVQLVEGIGIPTPNVVPFQYNPATVKRTLEPWNPQEVTTTKEEQKSPQSQPHDPVEKITLDIELDASDQLEDDDPIADQFGVADRIAALEVMLFAQQTPLGQLLASVAQGVNAVGKALGVNINIQPVANPTVAITLLVLGAGRIVPIRITGYSIEEQLFLPSLYAIQAKVSLAMNVLTPDTFKSASGITVDIAKAAYGVYRKQQTVLAGLQTARLPDAIRSLLPF